MKFSSIGKVNNSEANVLFCFVPNGKCFLMFFPVGKTLSYLFQLSYCYWNYVICNAESVLGTIISFQGK